MDTFLGAHVRHELARRQAERRGELPYRRWVRANPASLDPHTRRLRDVRLIRQVLLGKHVLGAQLAESHWHHSTSRRTMARDEGRYKAVPPDGAVATLGCASDAHVHRL